MHDWLLLKCPDCGNTFRVEAVDHADRAACSVCGLEMIYDDGSGDVDFGKLSAAGASAQTGIPAKQVAVVDVATKAAVAPQPVSEQPIEPYAKRASGLAEQPVTPPATRTSRSAAGGGAADEWDQRKPGGKSQRGALVALGGMAVLIVGGLIWAATVGNGEEASAEDAETASQMLREMVVSIPAPLGSAEDETRSGREIVEAEGNDQVTEWRAGVSRDPERFMNEVKPVLESFFAAESVDERIKWVADRERVMPLMNEFYARSGEAVGPIGVSEYFSGSSVRLGRFGVQLEVALADYTERDLVVVREGDKWRVDWEAFVRYSSMDVDGLKQQRPTETQLFRGRIAMMPSQYHNFAFSDAERWASLMLHGEDAGNLLYAYVDKRKPGFASELHRALIKAPDGIDVTLMLRYPENARVDNQVEVVDVVCIGFSDLLGLDAGKEE
ncbi:TFIIB-type zinc ribbon-containing protein [Sulfuriroseicoccus oceanibius]|uniref:TFIIB-type zinc ribbon-containing protein n=1 Tax=Sulfuriroseicoccus oceanibius TaxID=2707525 RepID=A0A6B3LC08_9BACT|nr:TFIIB-type zinc ribbon-containing protein [Sulfuriroseicoccus oceanibius]QQL44493.1 TFIIB-type zinc ribbon-containing protein [Sulfuriroseicoccus oceanibius]